MLQRTAKYAIITTKECHLALAYITKRSGAHNISLEEMYMVFSFSPASSG